MLFVWKLDTWICKMFTKIKREMRSRRKWISCFFFLSFFHIFWGQGEGGGCAMIWSRLKVLFEDPNSSPFCHAKSWIHWHLQKDWKTEGLKKCTLLPSSWKHWCMNRGLAWGKAIEEGASPPPSWQEKWILKSFCNLHWIDYRQREGKKWDLILQGLK